MQNICFWQNIGRPNSCTARALCVHCTRTAFKAPSRYITAAQHPPEEVGGGVGGRGSGRRSRPWGTKYGAHMCPRVTATKGNGTEGDTTPLSTLPTLISPNLCASKTLHRLPPTPRVPSPPLPAKWYPLAHKRGRYRVHGKRYPRRHRIGGIDLHPPGNGDFQPYAG